MKAILLLGSNLNRPIEQLESAIAHIGAEFQIVAQSSIYITEAWGNTDQADFYNQAIEIEFQVAPSVLMKKLIEIELLMGRKRINKWEPRIIDIDIIAIESLIIVEEHLIVPHPHMQDRLFVLIPFSEINDKWIHPILNLEIKSLIENCSDKLEVRKQIIDKI
jgi:2-amino-4-hydroxy-6-hydroxymethyldihydropteridine diphosphokinase